MDFKQKKRHLNRAYGDGDGTPPFLIPLFPCSFAYMRLDII